MTRKSGSWKLFGNGGWHSIDVGGTDLEGITAERISFSSPESTPQPITIRSLRQHAFSSCRVLHFIPLLLLPKPVLHLPIHYSHVITTPPNLTTSATLHYPPRESCLDTFMTVLSCGDAYCFISNGS